MLGQITNYGNYLGGRLLHLLAPEDAHRLALWLLKNRLFAPPEIDEYPNLACRVFGIDFKNPIGLAAGFDKDGEALGGISSFGFGHVEAGTVTPIAQVGNTKPRLFRLPEDGAIINRFGFNNCGIDKFLQHVHMNPPFCPFGINIGRNKDTSDEMADYIFLLERIYGKSEYITINVSSPNTVGLRDMQKRAFFHTFMGELVARRDGLAVKHGFKVPLLVKIAPDLDDVEIADIAEVALEVKPDGLIVTNTTIGHREALRNRQRFESGGLSGTPLYEASTAVLRKFYNILRGEIPLVATGGVASAAHAYEKIKSGASLVQLYTALIYQGFGLVEEIKRDLSALLENDGFESVAQAIGHDV